tara:strand:+ start:198 stop:1103 length:906 start_codon:yes stop_codon:yes gene_type:complete
MANSGKLNVGLIEGLSPNFTVTVPEDTDLAFKGDSSLSITGQSYITIPNGAPLDFDAREIQYGKRRHPQTGQIRFNTSTDKLEFVFADVWQDGTGYPSGQLPGSSAGNAAKSGMEILESGQPSGLYWISPGNAGAWEMYVDNSRNSGGWVLVATVRTSTCQDHMNNGSVRVSGTTGPRLTDSSTYKMADSWMNALVAESTYTGSTRYWMEATGFNKNVFIDSNATVDLLSSASNQNERTRITLTYEGGISDRGPNTGTRGFGDHHTSGGTYFAWGRHPEQGSNCGFREDSLGASNGYLWIK